MLPILVSGQLPSSTSYTTSASGAAVLLVGGSPAPGGSARVGNSVRLLLVHRIHHRHRTSRPQCLALDHVSVDVAGEDDGELGPGFASPDQPDGGLALELDNDWFGQLLLVPQGFWLGAGRPGRG